MRYFIVLMILFLRGASGCRTAPSSGPVGSFGDDLAFLEKHVDVVVLGDDPTGPRVVVVPQWQGRVMTSTAAGDQGASYGWINRELIAAGTIQPHINIYGGEDRFWMGPEGGQYAIFFKKGDPFDLEHWQTPAVIDTEPFDVVSQSHYQVTCRKRASVVNYSGTRFDLDIERSVRLLDSKQIRRFLNIKPGPEVKTVAYESKNTLTNVGDRGWTKDRGLLSIWILGMFKHSPTTTVAVPYVTGDESELGPIVNDSYFGKVPADRLKVSGGMIYFKGDGQYRSKIGLSPRRAKSVLGSYAPGSGCLTIVQYNQPADASDYVNSMWQWQDEPYAGDVVNSYNDGPPAPGTKPLGPFYELETSSPALELGSDQSYTHIHRTFHFQGSPQQLNPIALAVLGVELEAIRHAFE